MPLSSMPSTVPLMEQLLLSILHCPCPLCTLCACELVTHMLQLHSSTPDQVVTTAVGGMTTETLGQKGAPSTRAMTMARSPSLLSNVKSPAVPLKTKSPTMASVVPHARGARIMTTTGRHVELAITSAQTYRVPTNTTTLLLENVVRFVKVARTARGNGTTTASNGRAIARYTHASRMDRCRGSKCIVMTYRVQASTRKCPLANVVLCAKLVCMVGPGNHVNVAAVTTCRVPKPISTLQLVNAVQNVKDARTVVGSGIIQATNGRKDAPRTSAHPLDTSQARQFTVHHFPVPNLTRSLSRASVVPLVKDVRTHMMTGTCASARAGPRVMRLLVPRHTSTLPATSAVLSVEVARTAKASGTTLETPGKMDATCTCAQPKGPSNTNIPSAHQLACVRKNTSRLHLANAVLSAQAARTLMVNGTAAGAAGIVITSVATKSTKSLSQGNVVQHAKVVRARAVIGITTVKCGRRTATVTCVSTTERSQSLG